MIQLRRRREIEDIPASSMSDIAFLLLVFFMVASVFFVKAGILTTLPRKDSSPLIVKKKNVFRLEVVGPKIRLSNSELGELEFKDSLEFYDKLAGLKIPDIEKKYAVLTSQPPTNVQDMVSVMDIIRHRGFVKISMKKEGK